MRPGGSVTGCARKLCMEMFQRIRALFAICYLLFAIQTALGHGQTCKYPLYNSLAGYLLGFRLVTDNKPMAKDIWTDAFNVVRSDIAASF